MPYRSKKAGGAAAADEYASLGPRSKSGRLVWSQSSAQLSARSGGGNDDDDDEAGAAATPTASVVVAPPGAAAPKSVPRETQRALAQRLADVRRHFPGALCADDLLSRVEHQLASRFGFSGRNAIAVCNLCRDEATAVLRDRIEEAWGGAFTTSGLGGVLTCGVTAVESGRGGSAVNGVADAGDHHRAGNGVAQRDGQQVREQEVPERRQVQAAGADCETQRGNEHICY